jgi:hypothetical protein
MWMGMIFKIQNKVNDHTFGIICKSITIEIEKILVNTIRICPKIIRSWISRVASLGEERRGDEAKPMVPIRAVRWPTREQKR